MAARGEAWRWAPLLAAVVVALAWRGGYTADGRGAVSALAGLAALTALLVAPDAAGRATRHPVVLALAVLAAITALTALWTVGPPGDAARDGVAVLALAALVVAAAALPAPHGHAALLLGGAVAITIVGLVATAAGSAPRALEICGSWRPAGPLEYPPALALVCASAAPVGLGLATARRRALAVPGALAAWLLLVTVGLTANRTAVGLAALAVTACVALAPRARAAVGPVAFATIGAAGASAVLLHGDLHRAGAGSVVAALVPAALLGTWAARGRTAARPHRGAWTAAVAAVGVAVTASVVLGDHAAPCGGEVSHGRVGIWHAALDTALDRPLLGHGAGTFLVATERRQLRERAVPTRFAHELPLQEWVELGVGGLTAVLAWYAAVGWTVAGRRARRDAREGGAAWILAPAVMAFPLANLLDWPWALLGVGALWAVAAGGLIGLRGR